LVFEAEENYKGWDGLFNGVPQPAGAYVYFLQLQSHAGKTITKQGTILLMR
jgi:hypothetical protein